LKEIGDEEAELEDEKLFDPAFRNKCIAQIMSTVSSYKSKFELMILC
jgi:hypothetical protein